MEGKIKKWCRFPPAGRSRLTVIRDVSIKLLLKWFSAVRASSSDLKPMKPNLRNLPSLVNFRLQSVSVPKAANSCLKRSSFIYDRRGTVREEQGSPQSQQDRTGLETQGPRTPQEQAQTRLGQGALRTETRLRLGHGLAYFIDGEIKTQDGCNEIALLYGLFEG